MKKCPIVKPPKPPAKPLPPGAVLLRADEGDGDSQGHDSYPFVNIKLKNNSTKTVKAVLAKGKVLGGDEQVHPADEPPFVPIPGPSELRESGPNGQFAANMVTVDVTIMGEGGAADYVLHGDSLALSDPACRIQSIEITIDNDGDFARGMVTIQLDPTVQNEGGQPLDCRGDPFNLVKQP